MLAESQDAAHEKIAAQSVLLPHVITWLQHSRLRHPVQGSSDALNEHVFGTTLPPEPPLKRPPTPPLLGVPLVPLVPLVPAPVPVTVPLQAAAMLTRLDRITTAADVPKVFLTMRCPPRSTRARRRWIGNDRDVVRRRQNDSAP